MSHSAESAAPLLGVRRQLRDRLTAGWDDWDRAIREIPNRDVAVVNSQMAIDGRQEITGADPSIDWVFAARIGGADNLARPNSATGEQHRIGAWPMIATRLNRAGGTTRDSATAAGDIGDPRSSTKLARHHDQHSLVESALIKVLDQCGDSLIEERSPELERVKDVMIDRVVIPIRDSAAQRSVEFRGDHVHSSLDQPPGHQALLAPLIPAVMVASRVGFAAQVKRGTCPRAREKIDGLGFKSVDGIHDSRLIEIAAKVIERLLQAKTLFQPGLMLSRQPMLGTSKPGALGSPRTLNASWEGPRYVGPAIVKLS